MMKVNVKIAALSIFWFQHETIFYKLSQVEAFTLLPSPFSVQQFHSKANYKSNYKSNHKTSSSLHSTPFDISLYDDEDANPFFDVLNPLACPPNTKLVLGLNKYSHDVTLCAADATSGKVLFAMSKERLSRKKHHSGNVASLVETCLDQLELDIDNIEKVVVNNHHHRVMHLERNIDHLEWETGLGINGGSEGGYTDEENLLSDAMQMEMSHHLAHAYSAAAQCPFDEGLVVVMDGMGETYRTMRAAKEANDERYVSDLLFEGDFECIPKDVKERSERSIFDWREAESAYEFTKTTETISVKPIFKRFVEEKTPPVLYNHGFENMDSLGALYSRASSHIFGDWNACGKVMGLAPWMGHEWSDINDEGDIKTAERLQHPIMEGKVYEDGDEGVKMNKGYMMGTPYTARNDPDLFDNEGNLVRFRKYDFDDNDSILSAKKVAVAGGASTSGDAKFQYPTNVALESISLACRIQEDLESVGMDFVKYLKEKSNQSNLCLAGGVGLNSVLNGRLSRELGFEKVFIPPYPGDDGIAIGCCAYGLFGNAALQEETTQEETSSDSTAVKLWSEPLSPYLGPEYSNDAIQAAIEAASPWIEVEKVTSDEARYELMSKEIEDGGVIALYQGRSEIGPRALGHRSIIADPRKKGLVRFINESVKKRESFRPFAPSCLAEEAMEWFDLGDDLIDASNISPYMSMTAMVKEDKRELIPAVTHVDGSSRMQTVTEEAEPAYHAFISTFFKRTGVPMVLNTSFNTLRSEPIVESPSDAIRSFMSSMGSIEMLVMEDYIIKRKPADVRRLLGEQSEKGFTVIPSCPKRAGPVHYETKFTVDGKGSDEEGSNGGVQTKTRISMPNRIMHDERNGGWFELLDDLEGELLAVCNGEVGVNEIISQYLTMNEDGEGMEQNAEETIEYQEVLFSNIVSRLIRLYEQTIISW